jgi:hypothetical protein
MIWVQKTSQWDRSDLPLLGSLASSIGSFGEPFKTYESKSPRWLETPAYLFLELARRFEFYAGAIHYMRKAFFKEGRSVDPFTDFIGQLEILA